MQNSGSPSPPEREPAPPASEVASPPEPEGESPAVPAEIEERVVDVLRTVYDPEIPVDIWELGMIYETRVEEGGKVAVRMTLTSPMCPVAGTLPGEVKAKVESVDGVSEAEVELVWDPPWTPDRMSEVARLRLNF